MHAHHRAGLLAGGEERIPVAAVDAGQPEVGRDLAEAHGAHAAGRVAPHLGGRLLGVPQRDDAQREQSAAAVAAPLLDHEVVVGDDAGLGQLLVLGFEEGLAAEAGEGREAQAGLDPVRLVVGDAGLGVVAAGAHFVVGDGGHGHVVAVEADGGHVALVDVDEVLVDPAVGLGAVGVERLAVGAAADVLHVADAPALRLGAAVAEARRQPGVPEVRRLDDVVVDADDLRERRGAPEPRGGVVDEVGHGCSSVAANGTRGASDSSSARTDRPRRRPGPGAPPR